MNKQLEAILDKMLETETAIETLEDEIMKLKKAQRELELEEKNKQPSQ